MDIYGSILDGILRRAPSGPNRHTYRRRRAGEGQAQEHQQRNELVSRLHVGHGEVAVIAAEAHDRRGQHIRQLQEVQGHQGGQDDGELDRWGQKSS